MKINGLHPEHRHRRLIEEFHKSYKVPVIISIIIDAIVIGWLISPIFQVNFKNLNWHSGLGGVLYSGVLEMILRIINLNWHSVLNNVLFYGVLMVIFWISSYVIAYISNYYSKKYTPELIQFWVDRLFKDNWLFYFLDLNLFDQISMPETATSKFAFRFNLSGSNPASAIKYKFLEYFNTYRFQTISQKLLKLHPFYTKNKLIKAIEDDNIAFLLKFLPIYFATSIPIAILAATLGVYHPNWFLTIPIIVVLVGLWLYFILGIIIRLFLARSANLAALKAIFSVLYFRDPEHEITDQRILGIPKYINYPDLCKRVDSYMIDS